MEPDNMLSTGTLEDGDKHTPKATADGNDTKDTNKHNDDDDDEDETTSTANKKDNSTNTKGITSSSSSSSTVAIKRTSSTASLSEGSKRAKQEDTATTDVGPNSEEKASSPSALIEIVNDFARDHFDDQGSTYPLLYNGTGPISPILNENEYLRGYYDEQFLDESKTSDTEAKTDGEERGEQEQPQQVPQLHLHLRISILVYHLLSIAYLLYKADGRVTSKWNMNEKR